MAPHVQVEVVRQGVVEAVADAVGGHALAELREHIDLDRGRLLADAVRVLGAIGERHLRGPQQVAAAVLGSQDRARDAEVLHDRRPLVRVEPVDRGRVRSVSARQTGATNWYE